MSNFAILFQNVSLHLWGSMKLFVNEYRSWLSNHLLANCSYDTEKEKKSDILSC